MRLDHLWLSGFKNLRDFAVDFDERYLSTVLIGHNGTGKSNLLEALVLIFRHLDLGDAPPFAYVIRYSCRGKVVEINADPDRLAGRLRATVDGQSIPSGQLTSGNREYLPSHVFGYYSGPSDRLEQHFLRHHERFYSALIRPGAEQAGLPLRPLFYVRPAHNQFALLAFFVEQDNTARQFLERYLSVVEFESVLFVIGKPSWAQKENEDDRFWGARGIPRVFLDELYDLASAPARVDDSMYLFLPDVETLRQLYGRFGNQRDFFKTLESVHISDLLEEVRILVRVKGMDEPLTFPELSEGEQQLLTVLGLLRFTREDESLFLLDEPDTHLNPAWSYEYLELLSGIVGESETSHIIVATHDPLMIGGLLKTQVQMLLRDPITGLIRAEQPDQDPRGMGIGAMLTSELFGLRSTVDLETLKMLDRKRELAVKRQLSRSERTELEGLNDVLGNLDFTRSARDPLYNRFVEAMMRTDAYQSLRKPTLTPAELEQQRDLAARIIDELRSEQGT